MDPVLLVVGLLFLIAIGALTYALNPAPRRPRYVRGHSFGSTQLATQRGFIESIAHKTR